MQSPVHRVRMDILGGTGVLSLLKIPSGLCNLGFMSARRHTPHLILTCRPAYPRGGTGVHPPSHPPAVPCPLPGPLAVSGRSKKQVITPPIYLLNVGRISGGRTRVCK